MLPVLEEYKIGSKLDVFITDNTDSNDTVIRVMLQALRLDLNIIDCRSRCLSHIINLAAKALLFNKETSVFIIIIIILPTEHVCSYGILSVLRGKTLR
jgi:hypothetical protein